MEAITEKGFIPILQRWVCSLNLAHHRKQSTIKGLKSRASTLMKLFERDKPLSSETVNDLLYHSGFEYSYGHLLVKNLKQCIEWAVDEELLPVTPIKKLHLKRPDYTHRKVFLTRDELEQIKEVHQPEEGENIRQYFLLQCMTGLAFADLKKLKRTMKYTDMGEQFLLLYRKKTNRPFITPLVKEASAILESFDWKLQVPCLKNYNRGIAKILHRCDIEKEVESSHLARKTCAQYWIDEGFSITEVASFLGIDEATLLEHYATISIRGISRKLISQKQVNFYGHIA